MFPEGSSEYPNCTLNQYLSAPLFPQVQPCRDRVLHFLCIFLKPFRAVCKEVMTLITTTITPSIYNTQLVCMCMLHGRTASQIGVSGRVGPLHRAAQCLQSQTHILENKQTNKKCSTGTSFVQPHQPLPYFHQGQGYLMTVAHIAKRHCRACWGHSIVPFCFSWDEKEQTSYLASVTLS